jgi:hypothetical protein
VDISLAGDAPVPVELPQFELLFDLAPVPAPEVPRFVEDRHRVIGAILPQLNVIDDQLADLFDVAQRLFTILLDPLPRDVASAVKGINLDSIEGGELFQVAIPRRRYPSIQE